MPHPFLSDRWITVEGDMSRLMAMQAGGGPAGAGAAALQQMLREITADD
jgi:hypothetical protein